MKTAAYNREATFGVIVLIAVGLVALIILFTKVYYMM